MKNLLYAFSAFSSINLYKNKDSEGLKYVLCFLPLVGAFSGFVIGLWCYFGAEMGFGPYLRGSGGAVIAAVILGNRHFGAVTDIWDKLKYICILIYVVVLWRVFSCENMRYVYFACSVFTISRVMAILLLNGSLNIAEGIYKFCYENGNRVVLALVTVVWLMMSVSFAEMMSLPCFFGAFIIISVITFLFHSKVLKEKGITDSDLNLYIVLCEFAVFTEIILISMIKP